MSQIPGIFWVVLIGGGIGVIFALALIRYILRADSGTAAMQNINAMISEGAWAFIRRQYSTIGMTALVVGAVIGVLLGMLSSPAELEMLGVSAFGLGWRTAVAFLAGAVWSCSCGIVGMWIAGK